jgi:hypothetical protein
MVYEFASGRILAQYMPMQPLDQEPGAATPQTAPAAAVHSSPPGLGPEGPAAEQRVAEIGGPSGPDPARYGDWERRGRCIDF